MLRLTSKICDFSISLAFNAPISIRGSSSEYCHTAWYGKTRMDGYSTVEKVWGYVLYNRFDWIPACDRRMNGRRTTTTMPYSSAALTVRILLFRGNINIWKRAYKEEYRTAKRSWPASCSKRKTTIVYNRSWPSHFVYNSWKQLQCDAKAKKKPY